MLFIDYTHPGRVPTQVMSHDRRSAQFYLRLDELPKGHPLYSPDWCLFRYPEWLEGGSAWIQAGAIARDLEQLIQEKGLESEELRPVVGSQDPGFDEAVAQGLGILGYRAMIAEFGPRDSAVAR